MAAAAFCEHVANDELWRECANWLTKWEMLRTDHKANWPNASISDIANILRDGVLLCKLLNKIDPGCIDMKDVNLKPAMAQFLCLRNIDVFLRTCHFTFGLEKSDLFEAPMLFDLTNFHKVLCTLSKLSLSQKSLRGKIPGFQAQKVKSMEEEVIYQRLKSVSGCEPSWLQFTIPCPRPEDREEEVYDDLCYVTFSACLPEQQQICGERDFVVRELLDTEKNYVDVLSKLKKNFMQQLVSAMKEEDYEIVFFKIEQLYTIHSSFYIELSKVRKDPSCKLSTIFMRWRDSFLVYGHYCANLTRATTTLQELCDTDEIFNQLIIKFEKEDNNGRFKLRDVLSVPMQRILKYHLLLDKLIKNTDPNIDEYKDLTRAREAMLDVAGYINEVARDSEQITVINKLQENIVEWNCDTTTRLTDYGRLLKDAELKIRSHDEQKIRNRYVFIFEKCILVCKQLKGQQFGFRDIINISEFAVEDIHNRMILNKDVRWNYTFCLAKIDRTMAYSIYVRSQEMKEQIIAAIKEALDKCSPPSTKNTTHQFELRTFAEPATCIHCSKYLKGLLYQGYLCKVCNATAHKGCINSSGRCIPHNHHNGSGDCLRDKFWYVGEMSRTDAEEKLIHRQNGTYLVRIRLQSDEKDKYALSLKTNNTVKHMRISCGPEHEQKYYLAQSKYFNSIEELVKNYQENNLNEIFQRLAENTKLLWPYKELDAVAIRNYNATNQFELSIQNGEALKIISKDGYNNGFWKCHIQYDRVGYIPSKCVSVESPVNFE